MPFYEIQHSFPLSPSQRSHLAQEITTLHSTTFNAPSLFVNVKFTDLKKEEEDYFIGGKKRGKTNWIFAYVRSGPTRSSEIFSKLAEEVERIWNCVVGRTDADIGPENEKILNAVFIVPGLTAREAGFAIPMAGEEGAWLKKNWGVFKERAEKGDEDMRALIEDVESRPELRKGNEA